MQLNPAEISELIKSRIEGLTGSADIRNQVPLCQDRRHRSYPRTVRGDGGEMLEFPAGVDGLPTFGLALNLERDSVGAVILVSTSTSPKATRCAAPGVFWKCRRP